MPGIFGVLDTNKRHPLFRQRVGAAHEIPQLEFVEDLYESQQFTVLSIARKGPTSQCHHLTQDARSGAVLAWEGELFNAIDIRREFAEPDSDTSAALLQAYLALGPRFVGRLDGEFSIAVFETKSSTLELYSDWLGSFPLYYWNVGGEFHFASEKKCLLAACGHERRLDTLGLLQPFVHQHNLGDRTCIEGLKRMPPSSRLTVRSGRVQLSSYGDEWPTNSSVNGARELLEAWQHQLKAATAKRVAGKARLLISLSSGLDSRAIACSLERGRRPVTSRTMGHPESFEVVYAARIAAALEFEHVIENSLEFAFSDVIRPIVWRTDGETDFRNGLSMAGHGRARHLGTDIMGGWLGDVTSGAHLRPFMLRPMTRETFIRKVFWWYIQHTPEQLRSVFTKEFLESHWPRIREAFADSYAPFGGLPNTMAHEMWDLRNRQTRMTVSSMPVDSHLFGKVRPFFDRAYLEFVMAIPLRWRIGQNLYKSLISRLGPEIRAIPNGNTNFRIHESPMLNLAGYGISLGKRFVNRFANRAAPGKKNPGSSKIAAEMNAHFRCDVGLRSIIERFLRSPSFDDHVFDRAGIRGMLDRHYGNGADHSELISILASYVVALEYFLYATPTECPQEALPVL